MNIILVGFMGTGKSAVGERLAAALGWPFLDTDVVIEERAGCRIAEIFARAGEPGFREQESAVVAEAAARDRVVISTGGGVLGRDENLVRLKANGRLVCLTARPEVILERTHPWGDRPLLATASDPRQAVERLLRDRAPRYALADVTVDTSDLTVDDVARQILTALRLAPGTSRQRKPCDPSP